MITIEEIKKKFQGVDNTRYGGAGELKQVYCEIPFPEFSDISLWRPSRDRMDALNKALGDVQGKKILDLGCGVGSFCFSLSKHGCVTTGVDVDKELIEIANDISQYYNQPATFKCTSIDLHYLKSITEHYDYVLFLSLLHWITDLNNKNMVRGIFRELERIADHIVFEIGGSDFSYENAENATTFLNNNSNFVYEKIGKSERYGRYTYLGRKPTFTDFPNYGLDMKIEDIKEEHSMGHMYKIRPHLMVSKRPQGFYTEHYFDISQLIKNNPHPNIMKFYDSVVDNGNFYGLIEYVSGVSPSVLPFKERPFDAIKKAYENIFEYFTKFNILHRDVNATNLIWNEVTQDIVLIDWAESTWLDNPCKPILTSHYMNVVSPMTQDFDRYMSEFIFKEGEVDYKIVEQYLEDEKTYNEDGSFQYTVGSLGSMLGCLKTLYDLATRITAKLIVELGTDTGSSTIALLAACGNTGGKMISIDKVDCPVAIEKVKKYGLDSMWTFIKKNSIEIAREWNKEKIDFLFIDTSHGYEQTLAELIMWIPLVRSGGYIVFHDIVSRKNEVQKAIDEYMEQHGNGNFAYSVVVDDAYGLGLIEKR